MELRGSLPYWQKANFSFFWTARLIQSIPTYNISLISLLILVFHLCVGFLSGLFSLHFPTKTMHLFSFFPFACHVSHPHYFPWSCSDYPVGIWQEVQLIKLFIIQFLVSPCYLCRDISLFLNTHSLYSSLNARDQVLSMQNNRQN